MKSLVVLMSIFFTCGQLTSQTQELEQLRLNLEKLAQFKLMLSEMKSGYQTLFNGYNQVRDIGKSNFNLHQNYLNGLLMVNPTLKINPAIKRIFTTQKQVISASKTLLLDVQKSKLFTAVEIGQLVETCNGLVNTVAIDTELLLSVLTPGKFRMSDGERTEITHTIERSVQQQETKLKSLRDEYIKLIALRGQNRRDMESLKRLYHH